MTSRLLLIIAWARSHMLLSAMIGLSMLVVVKMIYTHPTNSLRKTQEHAIQRAKLLSHYIVNGDIEQLVQRADEAMIDRLQKFPITSFRDILQSELYETKRIPPWHWLLSPVHATFSPPESRMQLIKLERKGSFFVMTFAALKESYLTDYIDADGRPLLVSVAIRYVEPQLTSLASEWIHRLINVDWLPDFVRESVSGNWYLIDYRYSFSLRDYYNWVRTNEERLFEEAEKSKHQQLSEIEGDNWYSNLMNRASDEVVSLHEWSFSACEAQFTDAMHQLSANQNRATESKTN